MGMQLLAGFSVTILPEWHGGSILHLPPIGPVVRSVLSRPSSCVPDGALTLTYVSDAQLELRRLQFQRVRTTKCFMARVITVVFSANLTTSLACGDGDGVCVPSAAVLPTRRARREGSRPAGHSASYHAYIWVKWRLMHAVLAQNAREVLFLDADVVLFRNPFEALHDQVKQDAQQQYKRQRQHQRGQWTWFGSAKHYERLDLLYQGKSNPLNNRTRTL